MSNLQGTTVPSNAFVEKVYVNVDLSIEEVVSIIDSANLTYDFFSKYTVVDGIEISNLRTISVNNEVVFRESDPMNTGAFVGWKEGFNGIVAVNKQNSYGTQNDALSSLFSITPLTPAQDGQVIVSRSKLTAIGDNIRKQTNTTKKYTLDEMASIKLGGTDTTDATATSEDILLGKTAYVNDVKVVGTIEEYDGEQEGGIDNTQEDGLIDGTITSYSNSRVNKVRNYAFAYCNALTKIDLPNVTSIKISAFYYCKALTNVDLPNVTSIDSDAFGYCNALTNVDLPLATSISERVFQYCSALTKIDLPNVTSIGSNAFTHCETLTKIDLPNVTSIKSAAFAYCYSLKAVIIRQETGVCSLLNKNAFSNCYHILGTVNATYNPNGDKDGFIYVPDSKVNDYKQATNWSTYADQIKPLSEYVEV